MLVFSTNITSSQVIKNRLLNNTSFSGNQNEPFSLKRNLPLKRRWLKLTNEFGISKEIAEVEFDNLKKEYQAKGRYYHTFDHIKDCLNKLEQFSNLNPKVITPRKKAVLELALWYHDFKDDKLNPNAINESAEFAGKFLQNSKSYKAQVPLLKDLIMATKYFAVPVPAKKSKSKDLINLMRDLDFSALACKQRRFYKNSFRLRKEAAYVGKTPEQQIISQKWFLENLINQPNIFKTSFFRTLEIKARKNINAYLLKIQKNSIKMLVA